ncbi:hypothetical protein AB4528_10405 [Vibrio breoganii]|nr:hypothetical protein [Vibrio breoganii]
MTRNQMLRKMLEELQRKNGSPVDTQQTGEMAILQAMLKEIELL